MMISYAQNQEDIYLYRILKNIKKGFYIDVGANDPVTDSVTKLFYDLGWSGINIEPELDMFLKLQEERPRDININEVISNCKEIKSFISSKIRGRSTVNKSFIKNIDIKKVHQKESISLNMILHGLDFDKDIHFLKIDVEGHEKEVLEGLDLNKYSPWVIVVESYQPSKHCHLQYDNILNKYNYEQFFIDGVNTYFVRIDKKNLIPQNYHPVSQADNFISYHLDALNRTHIAMTSSQAKLNETEAILTGTQAKLNETEAILTGTQAKLNETEAILTGTEAILTGTQAKLNEMEAILTGTQAKLNETEAILTGTQAKLNETEAILTGTQAKLNETEAILINKDNELNNIKSTNFYIYYIQIYTIKNKLRFFLSKKKSLLWVFLKRRLFLAIKLLLEFDLNRAFLRYILNKFSKPLYFNKITNKFFQDEIKRIEFNRYEKEIIKKL